VENLLPAETGLYHKGYDIATHTLRLMFEFPDLARERYHEQCEAVVAGTGWTYTINDKPHQGRLAEVALEYLPADAPMLRAAAIHLETKEVGVKMDASLDGATANAAMAAFYQRTGWRLRLQMPQPEPQTDAEHPAKETAAAIAAPQRMLDES